MNLIEILDKIRDEIEHLNNANPSHWHTCDVVDREEVLEIIDRHKEGQKVFTPEDVWSIMVENGQRDPRFKLGETIKYSPAEVMEMLKRQKRSE